MKNNKGFTLVELMIALAMTGIIIAAVYSTYSIQKKTSAAQDNVVQMQQNIRAAVITMVQELRMAGYDPTTNAHCTIAAPTSVSTVKFQHDLDGNGDFTGTNEVVSYGFAAADDADADGLVDNADGFATLGRDTGGGLQPIAENIQAIEFLYTLKAQADGTIPPPTTSPTASQLPKIRTITISILARTPNGDAKYVNSQNYTAASGRIWDLNGAVAGTAANDNYRRRLLITTVQCRNMGI